MSTKRISKSAKEKQHMPSISTETYSTLPGSLEEKFGSYEETSPFIGLDPINYDTKPTHKYSEFAGHKYLRSEYTALPFYRCVDEKTPMKMVNLVNKQIKIPKYIVAPDGLIPNSNIGSLYAGMSRPGIIKRPVADLSKERDAKLIKEITERHMNLDKVSHVRKIMKARMNKKVQKSHFVNSLDDMAIMNNEVIDHFNFELEKVKSDKSDEIVRLPRPGRYPISSKKKKLALPLLPIRTEVPTKATEETASIKSGPDDRIDIDILDKLEKQIEDFDLYGVGANELVRQKILKDKQCKISDQQLKQILSKLEEKFESTSEVYNLLKLAINKDKEAIEKIDEIIQNRQSRLGLFNTITDPQHIFNYLLQFYDNISDLLDDIHDVLNGSNLQTFEKFVSLCGEKQKLQAFFPAFIAAKNFANTVFSAKFPNLNDRLLILENGLRGKLNENLVFNLFMSSEVDARKFFQCILECKIKDMVSILEDMKKISALKDSYETSSALYTKSETVNISIVESKSVIKSFSVVTELSDVSKVIPVPVDIPVEVPVPALPAYNEESWKVLMSQYLAQMVSNLSPIKSKVESEIFSEDFSFQQLMTECTFMHQEVLKLLKVYLNNDEETAKRILEGLVGEDDLAYQAIIELLGEKEALQIIKSLRLKQAKLIEKIIEFKENEDEIREAKLVYRSMLHNLPQTLCNNLSRWFETEDVDARDIKEALHVLTQTEEEISEPFRYSAKINLDFVDESSRDFFSKEGKKRTFSVLETIGLNFRKYSKAVDFEPESEGHVYSEKLTSKVHKSEVDYKGIRSEADNTLDYSLPSRLDPILSISTDPTKSASEFITMTKVLSRSDSVKLPTPPTLILKDKKMVCTDVCELLSEKSESTTTDYAEILNNLTEQLATTTDVDKIKEISTLLINIPEFFLLGKERISVKGIPEKLLSMGETLTRNLSIKFEDQAIQYRGEIYEEIQTPLEQTIMESFIKQQKIETFIQILKKVDQYQAIDLEKLLQDKKNVCSLYLPEVRDHADLAREMGLPQYQPFQIFLATPDTIIREDFEEINRHKIDSHKLDDVGEMDYSILKRDEASFRDTKVLPFFERYSADIFETFDTKEKPPLEIKQLSKPIITKESSISKERQLLKESGILKESGALKESGVLKEIAAEGRVPEEHKPFRKVSTVLKEPIVLKPLKLDAEIFQPEIVEVDDVLLRDDRSIEYEVGEAKLFRKLSFPKKTATDPYNDFQSFYGPTTFYLPFINPAILKKIKSGEHPVPDYGTPEEKKLNVVFDHLHKRFEEKKVSDLKTTNLFTKTRFIKRPSYIPLNDWIKIGAPGMSGNMMLPDMKHKLTNSRCQFHHLSKLRLHKYGLSATNYLQRTDLLDFISKANASDMNEKMRMKILMRRPSTIKSDSSSVSVIN